MSAPCVTCGTDILRTGRAGKIRKYCADDCKPRCEVSDCNEPQSSRGRCSEHYNRWRRTGDPLSAVKRNRHHGMTCSVDGCDDPRRKREWCTNHYAAWRKHGDPTVKIFRWAERSEACIVCGAPTASGKRRHCSDACWNIAKRARGKGQQESLPSVNCQACGDEIPTGRRDGKRVRRADTKTCRPCRTQLSKHGISANALAKEDGLACGLCGLDVDMTLRHPDLMRASVDHKVPVAWGGTNDRSNLQLAHLLCNIRKGARRSS
jgi:hypothetical protein